MMMTTLHRPVGYNLAQDMSTQPRDIPVLRSRSSSTLPVNRTIGSKNLSMVISGCYNVEAYVVVQLANNRQCEWIDMVNILFSMTVSNMTVFVDRLKTLRETRKLTLARLAGLIGMNSRTHNRWARSSFVTQLDTLIKIADVLNATLDELTGCCQAIQPPMVQNPKSRVLLQEMDNLADENQQALLILMDSLVKRSRINRILVA